MNDDVVGWQTEAGEPQYRAEPNYRSRFSIRGSVESVSPVLTAIMPALSTPQHRIVGPKGPTLRLGKDLDSECLEYRNAMANHLHLQDIGAYVA